MVSLNRMRCLLTAAESTGASAVGKAAVEQGISFLGEAAQALLAGECTADVADVAFSVS